MEHIIYVLKIISAVACYFICTFLGGWDIALQVLVCFTVLDFITGVIKSVKSKRISSNIMFIGAIRKILIYVVVAVAVALDNILTPEVVFRTLAIGYYIATEGLSILENISAVGLPLPAFILKVLVQLKDRSDNSDK